MPRCARFLGLWLLVSAFGLGPAGLALWLGSALRPPSTGLRARVVAAEAHGRAQLADARIRRWLSGCVTVAAELSALLSQLPDGPMGAAAQGTLMLHLQQRRTSAFDGAMRELGVLAPDGRTLLSTEGDRTGQVARERNFEAALAAQRPAASLVGAGQLVVAAPIRVRGLLRGVLFARLRGEATAALLQPASPRSAVRLALVDANGVALGGETVADALASLGGQSQAGIRMAGGAPVAFAPLSRLRAVIIATERPSAPDSPQPTPPTYLVWWGAVGVVVLAGLAAWWLCRRFSRGPRYRESSP